MAVNHMIAKRRHAVEVARVNDAIKEMLQEIGFQEEEVEELAELFFKNSIHSHNELQSTDLQTLIAIGLPYGQARIIQKFYLKNAMFNSLLGDGPEDGMGALPRSSSGVVPRLSSGSGNVVDSPMAGGQRPLTPFNASGGYDISGSGVTFGDLGNFGSGGGGGGGDGVLQGGGMEKLAANVGSMGSRITEIEKALNAQKLAAEQRHQELLSAMGKLLADTPGGGPAAIAAAAYATSHLGGAAPGSA